MKPTIRAAAVITAGLAFTGLTTASATAVEMPCNTARLIVPWGAGGESDILMRIVLEGYNRLGGKPELQVVTITGQGGVRGTREAKDAKPDGCTVFSTFEHLLAGNLTGRLDFSWDAFEPIARITTTVSLMGAGPNAPFDNYKEMKAWANANPGKLLAAGTLGSTSHFSLLQIQDALGIEDMKVVSYDGTADRMKAILADTVHFGQVSESTGAEHARAGRIKLLGINYHKRSEVVPDVPTAAEQGFPVNITSNRGWVLPKGTSPEIVQYYADMMEKAANDQKVIDAIERVGSFVEFERGEDYVNWWKTTHEDWTRIAKKLGVYRAATN
ncbi:MAG: tripartite tricarboxylate transporter substrate binding protein [Alphaproteobacteria bacterium]